ncbi:hypothetical protein INR49_014667, partial [Caranx melampygus]
MTRSCALTQYPPSSCSCEFGHYCESCIISGCARMTVNIYSCLLACVLVCNVNAGISHKVAVQKQLVFLTCPGPVKDSVKWSRDSNGERVDLITARTNHWIVHNVTSKRRYFSSPDNSLAIKSAVVSDSGTYYCNDEPAVRLTVILSVQQIQKEKLEESPAPPLQTPPPPMDESIYESMVSGSSHC